MTINISECINAVIKGSRNLQFTALIFSRNGSKALAQLQVGAKFSQTLMKVIEFNSKYVNTMNVLLDEGKCDCGYFQALHIPCRHVLASCSHARLDWKRFVHLVYRMESVFNPSYDGPQICPNPQMMRVKRGRPVSSRIHNNMDDVEYNGEKRCRLCRQIGHTWRTCTTLGDGGASSSRR
ncbi:hypothetical protein AHAS_Ahas06G0105400 [Arachis hypogaea]